MQDLWLVSYLVLWGFVFMQTLLLIALVRHIGNLRLWLRQAGMIQDLNPVEEGIPIGSVIPQIVNILEFQVEPSILWDKHKASMLFFIPAGFLGSEHLIPIICEFEETYNQTIQVILISFTPASSEQFMLARQHGIKSPIILEKAWRVLDICNIFTAPFALLLDVEQVVRAKAPISNAHEIEEMAQTLRQTPGFENAKSIQDAAHGHF